jgi:hypothetical protein
MSSYQDIAPEPKKFFLMQLLVDDEASGQYLFQSNYKDCVKMMYWVATRILPLTPKGKIEPLYKKLQSWMDNSDMTTSEVQEARRELSEVLSENFYSELHLGIIQTSTLPATKEKPKNEPVQPELSSRL